MPEGSATWRDCRRPACGSWRCSAPSTASAARPSRAPRSPRPSIRPPAFQSTVFTAGVPPPPTRCSTASRSCWSICQDAGARYYTYLFTTIEVMRAAARRGIPVVVLDRPDPIGGAVQGNVLDTAFRTPVGHARRADALRHDAGRAGPAGPGRPGAHDRARRRAGGRLAARDAARRDGPAVRPAEPEPPVAREPLPLSRALPVRGHEPLRRPGLATRRSSRSGRRGSTPRRCSRGCGRRRCPACDSRA